MNKFGHIHHRLEGLVKDLEKNKKKEPKGSGPPSSAAAAASPPSSSSKKLSKDQTSLTVLSSGQPPSPSDVVKDCRSFLKTLVTTLKQITNAIFALAQASRLGINHDDHDSSSLTSSALAFGTVGLFSFSIFFFTFPLSFSYFFNQAIQPPPGSSQNLPPTFPKQISLFSHEPSNILSPVFSSSRNLILLLVKIFPLQISWRCLPHFLRLFPLTSFFLFVRGGSSPFSHLCLRKTCSSKSPFTSFLMPKSSVKLPKHSVRWCSPS